MSNATEQERVATGTAKSPLPNRRGFIRLLATSGTLLALPFLGCKPWRMKNLVPNAADAGLNNYQLPPDSVVIETAVIDGPAELNFQNQLWQQIDETCVPPPVRELLYMNGLRFGIADVKLPAMLEELVKERENRPDLDPETGAPLPQAKSWSQRHSIRYGQVIVVNTSGKQDSLSFFVSEKDYRWGKTLYQAECDLLVRCFPQPNGVVRFDVLPEIQHGEVKQGLGAQENSLIFRPFREKQAFADMRFLADLRPGQTVVATSIPSENSLGAMFFQSDKLRLEGRQKLILMRLAQTQMDNLFQSGKFVGPLETRTE